MTFEILTTKNAQIKEVETKTYGTVYHVTIEGYLMGAYFTYADAETQVQKLQKSNTIRIY